MGYMSYMVNIKNWVKLSKLSKNWVINGFNNG